MQDIGHCFLPHRSPPRSTSAPPSSLRIAQLTDLHHWPSTVHHFAHPFTGRTLPLEPHPPPAPHAYSRHHAIALIARVLAVARPHLIVFTGDILDGRPFAGLAPDSFVEAFEEILKPLGDTEPPTPWAFTPGNHDDDGAPWRRVDLLRLHALPGCISARATQFDHTLTVSVAPPPPQDPTSHTPPTTRLYFLDSGENSPDPSLRYTTFNPATVRDLALRVASVPVPDAPNSPARPSPAPVPRTSHTLAYFHIPLPEYAGVTPVAGTHGLFAAALHKPGALVPFPLYYPPFPALIRLLGLDRVAGSSTENSGAF
eukprot:CAMPEP_0174893722 /NCGR_PEP_ID=MMETSP0167-20121228/8511_1 /TAXON_ID=38298 /ORGANISM="Rhodella maculata, Strain CCMP736" /LENGTH=312 /DNA_ID=CAMNT_0016132613 /DNA_START=83 /DNA_END=1018 /DNA_ORIENTATION=+